MILDKRDFAVGGRTVLTRVRFRPPLRVAAALDHEACFVIPVHARGRIHRPSTTADLRSGQAALMACGAYLNAWSEVAGAAPERPAEIIIVLLSEDLVARVLDVDFRAALARARIAPAPAVAVVPVDDLLGRYVESLRFYFEHPALVTEELTVLKVRELFLLLARTSETDPLTAFAAALFAPRDYALREIVDAHVFEDVSAAELAGLAGVSTSTFTRRFKAAFAKTPRTYISQRRLERAAGLLRGTDDTVAEVAYACGFADPNYFSRAFGKWAGCAPGAWRKHRG